MHPEPPRTELALSPAPLRFPFLIKDDALVQARSVRQAKEQRAASGAIGPVLSVRLSAIVDVVVQGEEPGLDGGGRGEHQAGDEGGELHFCGFV